jgi:hypothetical protein
MENTTCLGQSFQWKSDHPAMQNHVKSILKISKEEKEEIEWPEFPSIFTKIEEGDRHLEEAKPPEWMNVELNTKEFNISNVNRPKMARVGNYWMEKETFDIVDLLKEYQDVFARDYKYLKGLVEEMGEMKIELISGTKPIKSDLTN